MTQFPCDVVSYEGPSSKNPLSFKHSNVSEVIAGKTTLADLEKYALTNDEPMVASGRQEMIEGLFNEFI